MILYNGQNVELGHFPDGTLLMKEKVKEAPAVLTWHYENTEELTALYFLTRHIKSHSDKGVELRLPYLPNARQDRVKEPEDVFTLKYFCEIINALHFSRVTVLDPHSNVSAALLDRICIETPEKYVIKALEQIQTGDETPVLFFPDEGAMKRYSPLFSLPYLFGIKKRDWSTGQIKGLDIAGDPKAAEGKKILIIDDICSRGGTFLHSARALKALGAGDIFLYVSHCENTVLSGGLPESGLIRRIYTTDSIFTKKHEKVEVFAYE